MLRFDYAPDPECEPLHHVFVYQGSQRDAAFLAEVTAWCVERFGAEPAKPTQDDRWFTTVGVFWFSLDDDAFEFRMRWC